MNAEAAVRAFVDRLVECVAGLRRQFSGASRIQPGEPLMLFPRDGGPGVRVGEIEGVGEFELHGQGCLVQLFSGEIIDFDWDEDGREIFDGWRLLQFARTLGAEELSEDALVALARRRCCPT